MENAIKLFLEENDEMKVVSRHECEGVVYLTVYNTWDERHQTYEFFEVSNGDIHVEIGDRFVGSYENEEAE